MFNKGDRAKVTERIVRVDKKARAVVGDMVTITSVYNCEDGITQIVGIKIDNNLRQMIDIVCFEEDYPLQKINFDEITKED